MTRLSITLFALAACTAGTSATDAPGTITGVVRYDGPETGALRIVAYTAFPPTGAPAGEVAIDAPRFPQNYTLPGLPPGRYFVLAIVDTDPGDGDRYRPRVDPGGAFGRYDNPATVTVSLSTATPHIDVDLARPSRGSPWDR
jgi:hypothetical protein